MTALTLLILLALPVPAALLPQDQPGDSYASPTGELVLRSGPSANHPGVITLGERDVVRILRPEGTPAVGYVRAFVPQGFPVYLHGDFVRIQATRQTVLVEGSRLNVRLLPATLGLQPLGQLDESVRELQLLDVEGDWVRVLAPVSLSLFAPADQLGTPPASAAARWSELLGTRESRRRARVSAWEATDPTRLRDRRLEDQVSQLGAVVLTDLPDAGLAARETELAGLAAEAARADIAAAIVRLQEELVAERRRREAALATLLEVERERAREAANLVREARALDFGLRFLGKGESVTVEGLVTRRTAEETEAAVYSLQGPAGRLYKLSAASEIADLRTLIGKRVQLEGRSLSLINVEGTVLIVDSVVRVSAP